MALKSAAPFPIFPPHLSVPRRPTSTATEIRFSRWNNANAEPFLRRQRQQKEIEDDIRRDRRFQSATKIADVSDDGDRPSFAWSPPPEYKSPGTPSSPSSPSIRGKASKYSKPDDSSSSHPAFRRVSRSRPEARVPLLKPDGETGISVSERGLAYRLNDAPFEFQYSYTETPKVKPLALREQPFLPFGPTTMPRPWTGRAPLPPSKKKLPDFDSFRLPPPSKKGVKSVQAPGPYLAGSGPKYTAATREEILGEPLTDVEIKELIKGSLKTKRQLNMGRDGLTHNMLDNIHSHWKRRRVCKVKCKGVCTVDMDNVRQQLEEKTGGKIIYGRGGVIFLYRGRNYNYRTRPKYPLMLWKPMAPVYPRLVQRAPEGLTLEEAMEMRKRGRQLPPICKLGKNGVYSNLVKNVKEAFEECELVRINCKDMHKSDCRKIGAKIRDLVSCVLVSFEYEHILLWRGKDWKSSLSPSDGKQKSLGIIANVSANEEMQKTNAVDEMNDDESFSEKHGKSLNLIKDFRSEDVVDIPAINIVEVQPSVSTMNLESCTVAETHNENPEENASQFVVSDREEDGELVFPCLEGVMLLVEQAVEAGGAVVLDDESLDADTVLAESVALARKAQPGPIFQHRAKKTVWQKPEKEKSDNSDDKDVEIVEFFPRKGDEKRKSASRKEKQAVLDVVPYGSLGVDELAKLLA